MSVTLSRLLRQGSHQQGVSQTAVANELGISRTMISKWETGVLVPTAAHLERLVEMLRLPADQVHPLRAPRIRVLINRAWRSRPPYPIGTTIDPMLRAGGCAYNLHAAVRNRLASAEYDFIAAEFPRDTRHELLVVFHALYHGARPVRCAPCQYGCPLFITEDYSSTVSGAHLRQPTLLWRGTGERLLIFGQVPVRAGNTPYRIDFLIRYKRAHYPAQWVVAEIDGDEHRTTPNQDAERAQRVNLPEIRHDNEKTRLPNYFDLLLHDVRRKALLGRRWDRERKTQARKERKRRENEVASRR